MSSNLRHSLCTCYRRFSSNTRLALEPKFAFSADPGFASGPLPGSPPNRLRKPNSHRRD